MTRSYSKTYKAIFGICGLISMALGAQTVHMIYRPLDDLAVLVEEEKARIKREREQNRTSKE